MGLLDGGQQKAYDRQKATITKETKRASGQIIHIEEIDLGQKESGVSSTLKALFGGKAKIDYLQIYHLKTSDLEHYYIQPFSGINPLPGEHHALINAQFPEPVIFEEGILKKKWKTASGDKELAKSLSTQDDLKQAVKKLAWKWEIGMTKVELEWTIQMRNLNEKQSHLVMQAGRYGGLLDYFVGVPQFVALCRAFESIRQASPLPQSFIRPPQYDAVFLSAAAPDTVRAQAESEVDTSLEQKQQNQKGKSTAKISSIIRNSLQQVSHKKVFTDAIPEKKLNNMRKHVLPQELSTASIVGAIDLTMMGSAKDAVIFLNECCFIKEIEDPIQIDYADIIASHGPQGMLEDSVLLELSSLGKIKVPCGDHAELLHKIFSEISA